jgi:hypothetical protein
MLTPILIYPSNGAVGVSLRPSLTWQEVAGAQSYEYFLFRDHVDSSTIVEHGDTILTSTQIENDLIPSTQYVWRVAATLSTGGASGVGASSSVSSIWTFTTGAN